MANRAITLSHEDWERVNNEVDEILYDGRVKRDQALGLTESWRLAESSGDRQAARIIDALLQEGVLRVIHARNRMDTGVFVDSSTGQVLNVPKHASAASRDADGVADGGRQLTLWYEMDWPQFETWAAQQMHFYASLRLKARGIALVQSLREKYQDTLSPAEACGREGIDPLAIDITLTERDSDAG